MGLFTTEGILRKKNLRDVPKPIDGLSNILRAAYSQKMDADDIKIVDGASTYGNPYTSYFYTREYLRLKNVLLQDTRKPKGTDGEYPNALPIQTINNRLAVGTTELGEAFPTGGGDGLKIEYFNWPDVYGAELDIKSESGGSYVEGQGESSTKDFFTTNLGAAYASPNTFVAPTDAEAFFEFDAADLAGKKPAVTEVGWNRGVFNFGSGAFHPSVSNIYNAGVIKMSGYFNSGFSRITSSIEFGSLVDRFHIVAQSSRYSDTIDFAGTSLPTIIKVWEVDQDTGERLTSDQSPVSVSRYAPGYGKYDPNDGNDEASGDTSDSEGGRANSPYVYKFSTTSFGGINDQLYKLGGSNYPSGVSLYNVGDAYITTAKADGGPDILATGGRTGVTKKQSLIPFKQDQFFAIEIYFILSPRVTLLLGDQPKCALIEGYEPINNRSLPIADRFFFSENPLAKFKGKIYEAYRGSIPRHGSYVSGNTSPLGKNSPDYTRHLETIGSPGFGTPVDGDYTQLLSGQKITINYKPPRHFSDILVARTFVDNNFGKQYTEPHKYTDVLYVSSSVANKIEEGNLIIDRDSPTPRKGQDYTASPSGSVFAPFTYVDGIPRAKEYVTLSRPTIRYKNPAVHSPGDRTYWNAIDHKGIKGYGRGRLLLNSTGGPYGNAIAELDIGNQDCPHQFYVGETLKPKDIIIFEGYGEFAPVSNTPNFESPYMVIYDSPDAGGRFKVTQLASNGFKPEVTNFIDNSSNRDFGENRIKGGTDPSLFPFNSVDSTPGGRNFFIYRHSGLADESLDGFCSITTGAKVFEALVDANIETTSSPRVSIQRNSITSYDGDNIINPMLAVDANSPDIGILGQVADYNGPSSPSGAKAPIINKVFDHKFADTIVVSGFDGSYVTYNGTYQHDCIEYKPQDDIPHYYDTYKSEYGNPKPGDQFYFLQGQADRKIRFRHDNGKWELLANDGTIVAEYVSENVPFPGGSNISLTKVGAATGTPIIENHISRNSPTAPFSFLLTHPNTPSGGAFEQILTQDLKRGFGITIAPTGAKASTQYQCFRPTDTAPPFRATTSGIRSIPEGPTFRSSVRIGTANHSPDADFHGDTITSITVSEISVIGAYGDNSPGIDGLVGTVTVSGAGESAVNGTYRIHLEALTHLTPKTDTRVFKNGDYYLYQLNSNSQWRIDKDEEEDNGYYSNTATGSNPPTSGWATATEGTDPAPTLVNNFNTTSHARMTSQSDFTPGGVIALDATNPAITYDRRIMFEFIPDLGPNSQPVTYSILASSTHAAASP